MKVAAAILCGMFCASTALADDTEGKFDTAKALKGKEWVTAMLAPGGSAAAPSKEKPLDYIVVNPTKQCKALRQGTAKDVKALMKLKTCLRATYKRISSVPVEGQWIEYPALSLDDVASVWPKKYGKAIKIQAKDSTIVEGHFSGDGLNMDIYMALDADDHVHAVWVSEDEFE